MLVDRATTTLTYCIVVTCVLIHFGTTTAQLSCTANGVPTPFAAYNCIAQIPRLFRARLSSPSKTRTVDISVFSGSLPVQIPPCSTAFRCLHEVRRSATFHFLYSMLLAIQNAPWQCLELLLTILASSS